MGWLPALFDQLTAIIHPWAEQYGAVGLCVVALLDSSFLSLPHIADALLVGLTIGQPSRATLYTTATTLGSVVGCFALFAVGRKGGEAFLRRKFHERHIDRGLALIERHGWLAVAVPSLLPPPTPFKLFVVLAGVANLRPVTFLLAVTVGRVFRYGTESWLAYTYGERATTFVGERLPIFSAGLAGLMVVGGVGLMLWRRRRRSA